jgi:hypothetical protein
MTLATATIDTHALVQLIYVSLIAGVGICVVFALAVVAITRFQECRRAGSRATSAAYAALAAAALGGCGWAIIAGIAAMTTK